MIEFELSKGAIVLRARDDTYLSVRASLAGQETNKSGRYEMQADERPTHERKLLSSISFALSSLKSELHSFNPDDTLSEDTDKFHISFGVSNRFRTECAKDVQRLSEEYIYKAVVAEWWKANLPDFSKSYIEDTILTLDKLKNCFILGYPDGITGEKYSYSNVGNTYTLNIDKTEILNAIHGEVVKVSKSRPNKNGMPDITLQTSEIEGESLIKRYINQSAKHVSSRMAVYLDIYEDAGDSFVYTITMPETWMVSVDELCEEIHEYMVNTTLAEWFKSVLPNNITQAFVEAALIADQNIKHAISVRIGGVKKILQPF